MKMYAVLAGRKILDVDLQAYTASLFLPQDDGADTFSLSVDQVDYCFRGHRKGQSDSANKRRNGQYSIEVHAIEFHAAIIDPRPSGEQAPAVSAHRFEP